MIKKILFVLSITISIGAFAQSADEIAEKQTVLLNQELSLTETQLGRVSVIMNKSAHKNEAVEKEYQNNEEKKNLFIEGNLKDRRNALRRILTEEQYEKFLKLEGEL